MDVQSENEIGARELLHVLDDFRITLALSDELIAPMRKGMRADRRSFQSTVAGQLGELAAQFNDVLARVDNRLADLRAKLDDRLVHLGLDLLLEHDFSAFEDFLNVGAQLARLRIDNREFLLDAEGVDVRFHSPGRDGSPSRPL